LDKTENREEEKNTSQWLEVGANEKKERERKWNLSYFITTPHKSLNESTALARASTEWPMSSVPTSGHAPQWVCTDRHRGGIHCARSAQTDITGGHNKTQTAIDTIVWRTYGHMA